MQQQQKKGTKEQSSNKKKAQRVAVNIYHLKMNHWANLRIRIHLSFSPSLQLCVHWRASALSALRAENSYYLHEHKPIMNIHERIARLTSKRLPNVWQAN